jgi:predicted amidophosphoribosyltransferase
VLWAAAVDLLWGSRCVGCGERGPGLCAGCSAPLFGPASARVVMTSDGAGLTVFSATSYEDAVAAAVPAFKDRGRRDLLRPLAIGLATAIGEAVTSGPDGNPPPTEPPVLWLVPVVSSRAARRARGMSPVLMLSRRAARILRHDAGFDVRLATGLLVHVRHVADQAGLGHSDRRANLTGALAARPGLMLDAVRIASGRGAVVLLVDDVVTTGATLAECRRALAVVGVDVDAAVAVADTPLRGHVG